MNLIYLFLIVEALNSITSMLQSLQILLPQDPVTQSALGSFVYETRVAADPTG
jgi:hypothetical protein